ncbi:hypothetical protein TWF506_006899 [Arthrobotrys conoides]|uniref:Uncharacterized protein n=1 Tax=Arthrobotrys conoides TaxID=74498 RepID=A0AAN8S1L9_9PEZI
MQLTFTIPALLLLSLAESGLARTISYQTVTRTVVSYVAKTTVTVKSQVKGKGCDSDTFKVFISRNGWSCTHPNGDQIGPRPKPPKPTGNPTDDGSTIKCPPSKVVTVTAKNCPAVRCAAKPQACPAYKLIAQQWDCRCKTRKGTVSTYTKPCPSCCPPPPNRYYQQTCSEAVATPSLPPPKGTPTQITIVEPTEEPTREPGETEVKSEPTDGEKETDKPTPSNVTEEPEPKETKDVDPETKETKETKEDPTPTDTDIIITEAPDPEPSKEPEPKEGTDSEPATKGTPSPTDSVVSDEPEKTGKGPTEPSPKPTDEVEETEEYGYEEE